MFKCIRVHNYLQTSIVSIRDDKSARGTMAICIKCRNIPSLSPSHSPTRNRHFSFLPSQTLSFSPPFLSLSNESPSPFLNGIGRRREMPMPTQCKLLVTRQGMLSSEADLFETSISLYQCFRANFPFKNNRV